MRLSWLLLLLIAGIANAQTRAHVRGTRVSMVPPAEFKVAAKFSGFENKDKGSSIMVVHVDTSYEAMTALFTTSYLKKNGMIEEIRQSVTVNEHPATFLLCTQKTKRGNYFKQVLIIGDSTYTALINGVYPERNKSLDVEIRNSLMSVNLQDSLITYFDLEFDAEPLKLVNAGKWTLVYSADGRKYTTKPTMIFQVADSKVTIRDRKQFTINKFHEIFNGDSVRLRETNSIMIDDLEGYELIGRSKIDGRQELEYLVMLYADNDRYFIISGGSQEDLSASLELFKKIAATLRRR